VALRTGLAYLQALHASEKSEKSGSDLDNSQGDTEDEESLAEVALSQAQIAFDGGFATEGEWGRSPYLQRSFESFEDMAPHLPHWASTLYGALITQVQLTHAVDATEQPGEGA